MNFVIIVMFVILKIVWIDLVHTASVVEFIEVNSKEQQQDNNNNKFTDIKLLQDVGDQYDVNDLDLTCFTCDKTDSNEECNQKAIDEPCTAYYRDNQTLTTAMGFNLTTNEQLSMPSSSTPSSSPSLACLTIHRFDGQTLKTISVEKKCILDCSPNIIGCSSFVNELVTPHQHVRTCSYCCTRSYCNLETAINTQQAFNLSDSLNSLNKSIQLQPTTYKLLILVVVSVVAFVYNLN